MPSMSAEPGDPAATAPGWYGKLPVLGDFASRRLAPDLIEAWDGWLAAGIAGLQAAHGGAWLDAYLSGPIWRFVLMPGALDGEASAASDLSLAGRRSTVPDRRPMAGQGPTDLKRPMASNAPSALAGVLMPSVDRVGRYFPLTIMAPIETPSSAAGLEALLGWLHRLDDAAADALHHDWSVDTLEAELALLSPPALPASASASAPPLHATRLLSLAAVLPGSRGEFARSVSLAAAGLWAVQAQGLSFWLCEPADAASRLLTCRGLPRGDRFAELFGEAASTSDDAPLSNADRAGPIQGIRPIS